MEANKDSEHLRLLSIFHYVAGGVLYFFGLFPIIHVIFGLVMLFAPDWLSGGHGTPPPPFMGWLFLIMGGAFMLGAWTVATLLMFGGRFLGRRRRRLFCMVVAAAACGIVPIGTLLGVFTIIVLSRDSVSALFKGPAPGGSSPSR
jgi:hypothetical protein